MIDNKNIDISNKEVPGSVPINPNDPADVKAKKGQAEKYNTILMKLLHSPATSKKVVKMLKSGDPQQTIPQTALMVNSMAESSVGKPSLETLFASSQYLMQDIIEISNASGITNIQRPEEAQPLYQSMLQQYIEAGLKDKSIDPIELQGLAETFLSDEERVNGLKMANKAQIPMQPTSGMAMNRSTDLAAKKEGVMNAKALPGQTPAGPVLQQGGGM